MKSLTNKTLKQIKEKAVRQYRKNRIWLIGSGPSLKGFNFSLLNKEFTLAVNHSFRYYSKTKGVVFLDNKFVEECRSLEKVNGDGQIKMHNPLTTFPGYIFASFKTDLLGLNFNTDKVYTFSVNNRGIQDDANLGLFSGELSGMIAINMALIMGFREILLLGYDMVNKGGSYFFHDQFKEKGRMYTDRKIARCMRLFFKLDQYKHKIFNCSRVSALKMFQYKDPYEALRK